jgi:ArsR family transcriptional regulator
VSEQVFQEEINALHANLCQGLADPKRLLILYTLAKGPQRVTDLADTLDIPQPTTSHHLKILRQRGLVDVERDGTSAYYSLADARIIEALDILRAVMADRLSSRANLLDLSA